MHAAVGDRLIVGGDPERIGLIIEVPHADGTPPYVVRWLATGHIAMVSPGQFGRIVHDGDSRRPDATTPSRPAAAAGQSGLPDTAAGPA